MSIKTKRVLGNKQQKLLARIGVYLALLYNTYCLTRVTKTAKSHLFSARQNRHPIALSAPAPRDAHWHTYTRTTSQQAETVSQLRTLQVPGDRKVQKFSDGGRVPPHLHGSLFRHWQRGYGFVSLQGSYMACNVLGMSEGSTVQVRRYKCWQVISDQNQFTRSIAINK